MTQSTPENAEHNADCPLPKCRQWLASLSVAYSTAEANTAVLFMSLCDKAGAKR